MTLQELEDEIIAMLATLKPHPVIIKRFKDLSIEEKNFFKLVEGEEEIFVFYGFSPDLPFRWTTIKFVDALKDGIEYRTHILLEEQEEGF